MPMPREEGGPRLRHRLRQLAPGLLAGASDNDPTTVATMAVAGATTGFALSWLALLVFPLLATVQAIASHVGLAGRGGLQELVRCRFGPRWAALPLVALLAVNALTIGADLEAGAAALGLLAHQPLTWFAAPYAALLLGLLLAGGWDEVSRVLQYAVLAFLAYAAAAVLARPDWPSVLLATIRPRLPGGSGGTSVALAILGTTLTGYAYTWQVQEEAEAARPWYRARLARVDAVLGTGMAVAVFWFILIATGATLGAHHQQIDTAEQAAEALLPLAGPLAAYVFGIGLLASSFVAVPVLAATTGSVVCQQFGWRAGLDLRPREAPAFYGVMAGSLALAVAISLVAVPPFALLVAASIAGGLATPVGLVFLLLVARDRTAMHGLPVGRGLAAAGWVTTAIVTGVSLLYLWSQIAR